MVAGGILRGRRGTNNSPVPIWFGELTADPGVSGAPRGFAGWSEDFGWEDDAA